MKRVRGNQRAEVLTHGVVIQKESRNVGVLSRFDDRRIEGPGHKMIYFLYLVCHAYDFGADLRIKVIAEVCGVLTYGHSHES